VGIRCHIRKIPIPQGMVEKRAAVFDCFKLQFFKYYGLKNFGFFSLLKNSKAEKA
jgi:hypothetical protein